MQRAQVRASVVSKKKKEKDGASLSTPKDITKVTSKRKNEGKDDRPFKRRLAVPEGGKPKKSSPLKPSHGVGKGLMTSTGPVTQGFIRRLLTHKEHAIEMMEFIIKDTDMDPCAEQTTEELGVLGLLIVHGYIFSLFFCLLLYCSIADGCFVCRC